MKSKFKKLMAAALVLCLMLALLPAGVLANGGIDDDPTAPGAGIDDVNPADDGDGGPNSGTQSNGAYELGGVDFTFQNDASPTPNTFPYESGTGAKYTNGTIKLSYDETSNQFTLTATPNDGYGLALLKIGNKNVTLNQAKPGEIFTRTFAVDETSVTITAAFRQVYSFTVNYDTSKGSVTNNNLKAFENDVIYFSVTPLRGYAVESVKQGNTELPAGESGSYNVTMGNENVTVNVTFTALNSHNIWVSQYIDNGSVYCANSSAYVGETVNLTVNPDAGYALDKLWYYKAGETTGTEITNGTSFVMPDHDVVIYATFKETTYNITADTPTNGNVSFTVNGDAATTANYGDQIVVTVDPKDGYYLKSLKINGDEVSYWVNWNWHWNYDGTGTYTFNMPAEDVNIEAEFTNQLRIDTNYNVYRGEVEVLVEGDETYFADKGDWVAFKPVAYTNYDIGAISVTGNWTGRSYDVDTWYWHNGWYYFQMPRENVTINVEFTDNSHAVNVKDASNGTLKANTKWAVEDERVYITAVPDKGYELTWLSVKAEDGTKIDVYEALKEDTYYFFMPDQAVTVSAIFAYDYPDMPFTDVNSNSWYFNAVEFVYNKGIMQGVSSTKFSPNGTVTRGMLVTMLWRMAGEPYVGGGSFDDVASGSYYATAVAWAAKNGIVDGYNSTRFGPNDAVTREQIATMLYRYAKWLGYSASGSSLAGYSDASSVSSWAKDAMGWAVKNSVVTGATATKLNPTSSATRAETAQMFMNFYEYLN